MRTAPRLAAGFLALFALYHLPDLFGRTLPASAVAMLLFPLATWAVLRPGLGAPGFAAVGLGATPGRWRDLGLGLLAGAAFGGLSLAASLALGFEAADRGPAPGDLARVPWALAMTFFPSLAEDLLTRGYLAYALRPPMRERPFVLLSSAVYVGNHLHRLGDGAPVLLYLGALGLAFALALVRTGALWLTLGLHWGGNLFLLLAGEVLATRSLAPEASQWVHAAAMAALAAAVALGVRARPGLEPAPGPQGQRGGDGRVPGPPS